MKDFPIWTRWAMGLFVLPMGALMFYSIATAPARQSTPEVTSSTVAITPVPAATAEVIQSAELPPPALMQEVPNQPFPSNVPSSAGDVALEDLSNQRPSNPQPDAFQPTTPIPAPQSFPQRSFESDPPQTESSPQSSGETRVWVNTASKTRAYHYPNTRWYENTKHGLLMDESEAIAQGYHAAENGQ